MKQSLLIYAVSVLIFLSVRSGASAQEERPPVKPFLVQIFVGDDAGKEKQLLDKEEFAKPGVLIFLSKIDENVLDLVKKLNVVSRDGVEKDVYVVYLSKTEELDTAVKTLLELANLPMPIYKYTGEGPAGYEVSRDDAITVVVCFESIIESVVGLSTEDLKSEDRRSEILLKFFRRTRK